MRKRIQLLCAGVVVLAGAALPSTMAGAPAAETFTATASVKSEAVTATAPVKIVIDRFATDSERKSVMSALRKGGTHAVREALAKMKDTGSIEVGLHREAIKYAYTQPTGSGRLVTVVTGEPILHLGSGLPDAKPKAGYDVGVALLILEANDSGHGELAPAAKVKTNEAGAITIDDYGAAKIWLKDVAKAK